VHDVITHAVSSAVLSLARRVLLTSLATLSETAFVILSLFPLSISVVQCG